MHGKGLIIGFLCRSLARRWMIRRLRLRGRLWGGRRLGEECEKVDAVDGGLEELGL